MFPSEMVILMAIVVAGDSGKKLLTRPMDITGEYIGYLYHSLARRGFLSGNGSRGYQLTSRGKDALFEFLLENKTRVKDTVRTLQQLGIDVSGEQKQEIDKLEKEPIKVN